MTFFTVKKFIQYYLPVTLSLFMCVTIEQSVTTGGGYNSLYGLPFPYLTDSYACSFCYDVFIPTLVLNLLFFFAVTLIIFLFFQKTGLQLKTHWLFMALGAIVCFFWITTFALITYDSRFLLKVDAAYEIKGRRLVFGLPNP